MPWCRRALVLVTLAGCGRLGYEPLDGDAGLAARAQRLGFDTTPAGAGVATDVLDFPLLVRLDASTFDFATARADGGDVWFADADGTPLAHEIELWDPVARRAALWVLVPRVDGDSAADAIELRWGDAPDGAPGAVFAPARGWVGVWHLGGEDVAHDSAGASNEAVATATTTAAGPAGDGRALTRADDPTLIAPDHDELDLTGAITASAWVRLTPAALAVDVWHGIVSKRDFGNTLADGQKDAQVAYSFFLIGGMQPQRPALRAGDETEHIATAAPALVADRWHHLAMAYDPAPAEVRFYVDGALLGQPVAVATPPVATTHPLRLGAEGLDDKLDGTLDEVWLQATVRDPAWLELAYESQREDSRLLVRGAVTPRR